MKHLPVAPNPFLTRPEVQLCWHGLIKVNTKEESLQLLTLICLQPNQPPAALDSLTRKKIWIALPNEYEPLLRNQICIIFHHYLPWLSSEYHLRIMFDHSYCQNVHSQSQNRCFKEFANFRQKIAATKRPFAWGAGGWNAIWQNAVWTCIILTWGFPYWFRYLT